MTFGGAVYIISFKSVFRRLKTFKTCHLYASEILCCTYAIRYVRTQSGFRTSDALRLSECHGGRREGCFNTRLVINLLTQHSLTLLKVCLIKLIALISFMHNYLSLVPEAKDHADSNGSVFLCSGDVYDTRHCITPAMTAMEIRACAMRKQTDVSNITEW